MDRELIKDRFFGCIFGQAIGDALGYGAEFKSKDVVKEIYPRKLKKYGDIKGWNPDIKPSEWTDDTEMALCIVKSIIADKGVNYNTIAKNFVDWVQWSPDVGGLIGDVLFQRNYLNNPFETSKSVNENRAEGRNAGNGALMRTSVVGLLKDNVKEYAENICKLTHYNDKCIASAVIISEIIHSFVYDGKEYSIEELIQMSDKYYPEAKDYILLANEDDIEALDLDDRITRGYTLKTLSGAIWTMKHAKDFKDGLVTIVNEGGDADTNAAVACAVLGAKFGYSKIPEVYTIGLKWQKKLYEIANKLFDTIMPE